MNRLEIDNSYFSIKLDKLNHTFMKKQVNLSTHAVEEVWSKLFSRDVHIYRVSSFIIISLLNKLQRNKLN